MGRRRYGKRWCSRRAGQRSLWLKAAARNESGSREVHVDCGGTVVLVGERWTCRKCRRGPLPVSATTTVYDAGAIDSARKATP